MPGLVPGICALLSLGAAKTWTAGTSPADQKTMEAKRGVAADDQKATGGTTRPGPSAASAIGFLNTE